MRGGGGGLFNIRDWHGRCCDRPWERWEVCIVYIHIYLCFFLFWIGCWIIRQVGLHLTRGFKDIQEEFLAYLETYLEGFRKLQMYGKFGSATVMMMTFTI